MNIITITDINTRLCGLKQSCSTNTNSINEAMQVALEANRLEDIKRYIREYSNYANQIPFYSFIKLFESLTEKGSCSDINSMAIYIAENVIPKVRDAKSTNSMLKGRLTRMMHKISNPIKDAFKDAMNNMKITTKMTSMPKNEAVIDAYNIMLNRSVVMMNCDRVLENYENISRRFNLDKVFVEDARYISVGDIVVELCNKIDTYDMPTLIKFNSVIETAWYGFEHYRIPYRKSDILEAAVDYFLFKPDGLEACRNVLESTLFFDKNEDMGNIDIFTEEEPEEEENTDISDSIRDEYSHSEPVNEDTSFRDIFNKFKQEELAKDDKPQNKLRSLISTLYSKDIDSIIEETPDILQWIRRFFIVGTCAIPHIGPVIAAIAFFIDKFLSMHYEREETSKMIKCLSNEIKSANSKRKTTTDPEEKEKLDKYIKALEDGKDRVNSYYNDLLTEEEQDAAYNSNFDDDDGGYEDEDDDFDFDDEDDDFSGLIEGAMFSDMYRDIKTISAINKTNTITEKSMFNIVISASDEDVVRISKAVAKYPDLFFKEAVSRAIDQEIQRIRFSSKSTLVEAIRLDCLVTAMGNLQKSSSVNRDIESIYEAANEVSILADLYSGLSIMADTYTRQDTMLEASFMNTLRVASMKLKNAMSKMSTKEKSISRSIDIGMNNFKKSIENSFTNDNREAIVKGSVLPSFSKILKLCIVNAGLMASGLSAVAVIGTLGYIGMNGKFKHKERQMIIDEIEIELQICEKYINIAEQKNDMKALKQLLTTKRELERQRQRIKYKMNVDFGQKYYDASSSGRDND